MKSSLFLCIASIVPLTGWAADYPTTYNSIPQGATLVCGNSVEGTTPHTGYRTVANLEALADLKRRREKIVDEFRAKGAPEHYVQELRAKFSADGCRAVWTSGATAIYEYVDADTAKAHPNGLELLVNHPGDANTRIMDARSAQAQQLQPQQQQQQQQQQVQQQQSIPVFHPQALPTMPATAFPSTPGRTTTICRTLSNGTVVCD